MQKSVPQHNQHKLSAKYYGPYTIIEKIREVSYKLNLPSSSTIHPVFHVSQLKRNLGNKMLHTKLPDCPKAILDRRPVRRGSTGCNSNLSPLARVASPSEATWEFIDDVKLRFLSFNLEDKVFPKGRELLQVNLANEDCQQEENKPKGIFEKK